MKGAAGWGRGEASPVPPAGGPTGRSTPASDRELGRGQGRSSAGSDSAGDEVFLKHNAARQPLGLRDHRCLDPGGRRSEQRAVAPGEGTPDPQQQGQHPRCSSLPPPPLGPHFPQSFSRLCVLLTFTNTATDNQWPSGPLQPPPNMAAS